MKEIKGFKELKLEQTRGVGDGAMSATLLSVTGATASGTNNGVALNELRSAQMAYLNNMGTMSRGASFQGGSVSHTSGNSVWVVYDDNGKYNTVQWVNTQSGWIKK